MNLTNLTTISINFFLVGALILQLAYKKKKYNFEGLLESSVLSFIISLLISLSTSLILGLLGYYNNGYVVTTNALLATLLIIFTKRNFSQVQLKHYLFGLGVFLITVLVSQVPILKPAETFIGGGDVGAYANAGTLLSGKGSFKYSNSNLELIMESVDSQVYSLNKAAKLDPRKKTISFQLWKYYYTRADNNQIEAPFFPLTKLLIANSIDHSPGRNPLSLLNLVFIYSGLIFLLLIKSLTSGKMLQALSLTIFFTAFPIFFYMRSSMSEGLSLTLVLTALLGLIKFNKKQSVFWLLIFLASLLLNSMNRVDAFLIGGLLWGIMINQSENPKRKRSLITVPLVIQCISFLTGYFTSYTYSILQLNKLIPSSEIYTHPAFLLPTGIIITSLYYYACGLFFKLSNTYIDRASKFLKSLVLLIPLVFFITRPFWDQTKNSHNLFILMGFVSCIILTGALVSISRDLLSNDTLLRNTTIAVILFSSLYLYNLRSTPENKLWWIRRLIPFSIPLLYLYFDRSLQMIDDYFRRKVKNSKLHFISLIIIVGITIASIVERGPLIIDNIKSDYLQNFLSQIENLNEQLGETDIIITTNNNFAHKVCPILSFKYDKLCLINYADNTDDLEELIKTLNSATEISLSEKITQSVGYTSPDLCQRQEIKISQTETIRECFVNLPSGAF